MDWDHKAAGVVLFLICFFLIPSFWKRKKESGITSSALFQLSPEKNWRMRLAFLPRYLSLAALSLFLLALLDFHTYKEKEGEEDRKPPRPMEGIAIYLVLDQSGSMHEKVMVTDPFGIKRNISKIELLKSMTEKFILGDKQENLKGRSGDLVGVVTFARGANVLSPLTLDHQSLVKKLENLSYEKREDQLGTAIGYAIYKSASLIAATRYFSEELIKKEGVKPAYEIKSSAIVLVTDGFQEINEADKDNPRRNIDMLEAAEYAKNNNIRLYVINIEPRLKQERFTPYRELFDIVTKVTGGRFFIVDNSEDLSAIYAEIDDLEKSTINRTIEENKELLPHLYERLSFNTYFIKAGMVLLFISLLLETTLLRRSFS